MQCWPTGPHSHQKLEQNRRKLFPKPLRLLSGTGLCPVPGPGLALQRGGRLTCHPTRSPSSPPQRRHAVSPSVPVLAPVSASPGLDPSVGGGLELHKGHVPELRGQLGDRQSPPNPGLSPAFGPEGIDH